jgi:polyisoprenoid-binding protein YceI
MCFNLRLLFILCSLLLPSAVFATPANYTLDNNHTYVLWHISHFGFSNPSGKWMANGDLVVDQEHPENSKVKAVIKVGDTITGIPKLDEHLKSENFFDAAKYPDATFESTKITKTGPKTAKVQGVLTLHGVSKPVTLNVTIHKVGASPMTKKETIGFAATTKIKRSEFGIKAYLPGLGDEVKLDIEGEATKS